jgi:acetoin utilization deacetylase AcuC-like enzyme
MLPVIYDATFLDHKTGAFHPESPDRISAIENAIAGMGQSDRISWQRPTPVSERSPLPWIEQVHDGAYVRSLQQLCAQGGGYVDGDTPVSAASYAVALLAVNAWLDGVDRARAGSPCFVAARPPGHHALPDRGMGFCLFSNAAISAHYALAQGCARVAILDWDVHHGNGTQAIVEHHPQIAYCSLHEFPHYPGTGLARETGVLNTVLNIPMNAGSDGSDYDRAFEFQVMPFLRSFGPEVVIVSAGYDAAAADPLSSINLMPVDYGRMTRSVLSLTRSIVFGLEGGYDLGALGASVVATIEACLEMP